MNADLAHIDVSTFLPGIYILKISNKNGDTKTEKIVVN
ncbi:MAG: T9SS type A sorting domain-containing protein [Draconibacterium sp.]|nr:T9SS type A sorting domain-containing protein [Draconibacterium sp.]